MSLNKVNDSLREVTRGDSGADATKGFLKFYETASKGSIEEEMKDFLEVESSNKVVKSETYY